MERDTQKNGRQPICDPKTTEEIRTGERQKFQSLEGRLERLEQILLRIERIERMKLAFEIQRK